MQSEPSAHVGTPAQASPVTERILRRLGRPRWLWITLWALVPLASPFVFASGIRLSGRPFGAADFLNLLATQAVLAYACFVLLWGCGLLGRQAAVVRQQVAQRAPGHLRTSLFEGMGSTRGPLLLTGIAVTIVTANGWARYGPLPPLSSLPLLIVYLFPIMTFVWVFLAILVDVDRLGRRPLALDLFPQDRTLGLDVVGGLASSGLGLLLIAAVPVLFAGSDEPVTLGISLAIVAMSVTVFVLSMWRLHRQLVSAKARYVAIAQHLYAEAYEPVRRDGTVETLETQASVLGAAQSLDERAHGLPTWPIDEGTAKFIAVVITGVVTSLIVRALLVALES